jgi:hypothetical protein
MKPKLPTITIQHLIDLNDIDLFCEIPEGMKFLAIDGDGEISVYSERPRASYLSWVMNSGRAARLGDMAVKHGITNWSDLCYEIEPPTVAASNDALQRLGKRMYEGLADLYISVADGSTVQSNIKQLVEIVREMSGYRGADL